MAAVPAVAIRAAGTAAVSWLALTNVVDSPEPFHRTADPETNPLPLTVSVKGGPPAVALAGIRDVRTRVGLLMTKLELSDGVPPDTTVIAAVPAPAIKAAGTTAVSWPAFTNVVDSAEPFHCTDAPEANPPP